MPIRQEEVFHVLKVLCEDEQIYVTVKGSLKGGIIAGVTTTLGGVLLGPPGMLIGGSIGGYLAYKSSHQFRPVGEVLWNMPKRQRDDLHRRVSSIINHLDASDAVLLLALIRADPMIYSRLINFVKDFVTSDLNMNIRC